MPKKSPAKKSVQPKSNKARSVVKWFCLSLAGAIFISTSLLFYLSFSLLNTNRFMDIAGPLIQKPSIQKVIATDMTNALFEQVDVEKITADALPPKISFLAPAVYGQVKKYTESTIEIVIKNEKFQNVWNDTLRNSHSALVTGLREYKGDGKVNIDDVYKNLQQKIKNPKLDFIDSVQLPNSIGSITIIDASWLPIAHNVVSNIYLYRIMAVVLLVILLAVVIWVSSSRRKALIQTGLMLATLSLLMLVGIRLAKTILLSNVDASHLEAANDVWETVIGPFTWQVLGYMFVALVVTAIAWMSGNTKTAMIIRKKFNQALAGKLHKALFAKENHFTKLIASRFSLLIVLVSIGFVVSLLIINLSVLNVIITGLVYLLLITAISILAAPKARK